MSQTTINVGTVADDGTGDPLRTAFQTAQSNFTDLYSVFKNYIAGVILSYSSTTVFGISAGVVMDSTNAQPMVLASAYTKSTSAWAVGTGNGALDTGSIATATWYHVYVIKRVDTNVVDILFSTHASSPTLPTNYTLKRRIGSLLTDGSSHWIKWVQDNDTFMWDIPVADVAASNPGTAAVTRTLTTPLGVRVKALFFTLGQGNNPSTDSPGAVSISDLSLTDIAASSSNGTISAYLNLNAGNAFVLGGSGQCYTNTSSQVRSRVQISSTNTAIFITTMGWVDTRGADA